MTPIVAGILLWLAGVLGAALLAWRTPRRQALLWSRATLPDKVKLAAILAGLAVVLGIWLIGYGLNPDGPTRIPGPVQVAQATIHLFANNGWLDITASAARVLVGFGAAASLSILVAFALALHSVFSTAFSPVLSFVRYIPPTAFTALLVIYFGIDELYKTAVIFVGVFFFNFRMTLDIIEDFDQRYIELAQLTGASFVRKQSVGWLFATTVIPASWPRLWDMLRINLSFAWTFLIVAEVVGAQYGLGKEMYLAQRFFRVDQVFACILLFGLIGLLCDFAMAQAKRVLFRWHEDAIRG